MMDMNILYKMRSYGYVESGNDIWFSNLYFNALIRLDKLSGKIQVMKKFPDCAVGDSWMHSEVNYLKNQLIFTPAMAESIVSYHVQTGKFFSIALEKKYIGERKPYFGSAYLKDKYIYMFPIKAKCMIKYNVIDHSIEYLTNSVNEIVNSSSEEFECFYRQFEVIDEKIYIPFLEINAVAVFNLKDESLDIHYLKIAGGCSTINYIGGYFYLGSWKSSKIYRWDIKTGEIVLYNTFPKKFFQGNKTFACAHWVEKHLVFFPEMSNMIISMDVKTGKIKREQQIYNTGGESIHTFFADNAEKAHKVLMVDMEGICLYGYEKGKWKLAQYCRMDDLYNRKQISNYLLNFGYYKNFYERDDDLEKYIDILYNADEINSGKRNGNCGKKIFSQMQKV